MKFLKKHITMETLQLPSLQMWLGHELESRGIDSMIYSRHIIQLLQQDDDDQDCPEFYDFMYGPKMAVDSSKGRLSKTGKRKTDKRKITLNTEDRKKSAAIECLQAVSEEDSGIEILVEELCSKLREINTVTGEHEDTTPVSKPSSSSTTDNSDISSPELEDPAERYYAAFPALQGQEPSILKEISSPYNQDAAFVWKNNPITKQMVDNSQHLADSGNESEKDLLNKPSKVKKKEKKDHDKTSCPLGKSRKKKSPKLYRKPKESKSKNYVSCYDHKMSRFLSWPQTGCQQFSYDFNNSEPKPSTERELCYQVEHLLKEILLPVSGSPYLYPADLAGSDYEWEDACIRPRPPCKPSKPTLLDERISPELQEREIWYTQPLDSFFTPDKPSHQRLYKRHSCPSFDQIRSHDFDGNAYPSTMSSPTERHVFDKDEQTKENFNHIRSPDDVSADEDSFGLQTLMVSQEHTEDFEKSFTKENSFQIGEPSWFNEYSWLTNESVIRQQSSQPIYSNADCIRESSCHPHCHAPYDEDAFQPTPALSLFYTGHHSSSKSDSTSSSHSSASGVTLTGKENQVLSEKRTQALWSCDNYFIDCIADESKLTIDPFSKDSVYSNLSNTKFGSVDLVTPFDGQSFSQQWQSDEENKRLMVGTEASQLWDVKCQGRFHWEAVCPWKSNGSSAENGDSVGSLSIIQSHNLDNLSLNQNGANTSTNTLIPVITFALVSDEEVGETVFTDDETEDNVVPMNNSPPRGEIDRSVSLNELQLMLSLTDKSSPNPQLSRSFELVPSERSAFDDVVPRRLHHVQSEPDLKRYYKEGRSKCDSFIEKIKLDQCLGRDTVESPEEHLYYSSKTHFQPIQDPEDKNAECNNSGSEESLTDFHLKDLFGGYSKTSKTPYQKYQDHGTDSVEETFVPMFKICEEHDKYIQTIASPEAEAAEDQLSGLKDICPKCGNICLQSPNFEAVALSENQGCVCLDLFQYVLEEFDINGYIDSLTASEQNTPQNIPDNQHTFSDSGYEDFDVSGSVDESRQMITRRTDTTVEQVPVQRNFEYVTLEKASGEKEVFSQENGWVMFQMENNDEERKSEESNAFVNGMTNQVMLGFSKENVYQDVNVDEVQDYQWSYDCWSREGEEVAETLPIIAKQNLWNSEREVDVEENYQEVEYPLFFDKGYEKELNKIKENESSLGVKGDNVESNTGLNLGTCGPVKDTSNKLGMTDRQHISEDVKEDSYQTDFQVFSSKDSGAVTSENVASYRNTDILTEDLSSASRFVTCDENDHLKIFSDKFFTASTDKTVTFNTKDELLESELPECSQEFEEDVIKIRLVFHRGRSVKSEATGHLHQFGKEGEFMASGDCQKFMPMPSKAVYSTDLEKEWLNGKQFPPDSQKKTLKPGSSGKGSKKKPCTFFMEGNCRRVDCKFAHDLSVITCRFWEEGECFKSEMCPFLHGYYSDADFGPNREVQEKFDFKADDFPDLAVSSKEKNKGKVTSIKKTTLSTNDSRAQYLSSRKLYRKSASKLGEKNSIKSQMDHKSCAKNLNKSSPFSCRHSEMNSQKKSPC